MSIDTKDLLLALFGASGWGVAIVKLITDLREDARKARDDARKEREEERKEHEAKAKIAEQIAPFITELNSPEYLVLYKQIKLNSKYKEDGSPLTEDAMRTLRNYPGKLEDIGALMLAGKFSQAEVYDWFGEEILACDRADFLWGSEDLHYWKVFKLLAKAMEQERMIRERLSGKSAGPRHLKSS